MTRYGAVPSRRRAALGAAALGGAALAWQAQARRDRRAVERDPQRELLTTPSGGREQTVRAADGTELHVERFGDEAAPIVVLVHGWTCQLDFWTRQIQDLSRDHHVIAYDLRGHGRSGRPPGDDHSVQALGDDLQAVLDACVPAGRQAVLAGHSLGGMTVVAWAERHAAASLHRIAAAALLNTGMGDLVTESLVVRLPGPLAGLQQAFGRAFLEAPTATSSRPNPITHRAIRHIALSSTATPAQVAFCERIVLACNPGPRAAFGRTLTKLELYDAVASLDVPTLVVAGTDDRLTPPVHAHRLAQTLPQPTELLTVPGGHMSPVEQADAVNAALRELTARRLAQAAAA